MLDDERAQSEEFATPPSIDHDAQRSQQPEEENLFELVPIASEQAAAREPTAGSRSVRPPSRADVYGPPRRRGVPKLLKTRQQLAEEALRAALRACARKPTCCNRVAIIGPQGGTGKTRMSYALGAAIADQMRLPVIAVDIDDDYGALPDLAADDMRTRRSLVDLLRDHDSAAPLPLCKLRPYLSPTPSGMLILAGPRDPRAGKGLTREDLDRLLSLLSGADVVILDCAGGITDGRAAWAISRSDQRVVVARPEYAGASAAANALHYALPSEQTWLVLNGVGGGEPGALDPVRAVFARAGLDDRIEVPWSVPLAESLHRATYRLEEQRRAVRLPILELATRVAEALQ